MLAERIHCQFCVSFLQLGAGTNTNSNVPTTVEGLPAKLAQVAAGFDHACALLLEGAWSAGDTVGISSSTGGSACALNASQQAYCWGDDSFGELG